MSSNVCLINFLAENIKVFNRYVYMLIRFVLLNKL